MLRLHDVIYYLKGYIQDILVKAINIDLCYFNALYFSIKVPKKSNRIVKLDATVLY